MRWTALLVSEKWHFVVAVNNSRGQLSFQSTALKSISQALFNEVCICKNMSRYTNKKMSKSPWELYGHRTVVGIDYLLESMFDNGQLHRDVIMIDISLLVGVLTILVSLEYRIRSLEHDY